MKRLFAALLAAAMLLSLAGCGMPAPGVPLLTRGVTAAKVTLQLPDDTEYFLQAFTCTVKSSRRGGAIYLRARPEEGSDTMGTVKDGTEVSILAEHGDFYFFETPAGKQAWNAKRFFTIADIPTGIGSYSEVSTRGVRLQRPQNSEAYRAGTVAYAQGEDGWIYILPKARTGDGHLGILASGSQVLLLGESGSWYYFETADGRAGWSPKASFTTDGRAANMPVTHSPYGTAYYDYHVNGRSYSEDQIHQLIVDTYYSRHNPETNKYNEGYSSGRNRTNDYGYDFGFYYGDDQLYYAEVRSGSPLKIQVKLYYDFDGRVIGCRDYRGDDSALYKSGSAKCTAIAQEFSYVYDLAAK